MKLHKLYTWQYFAIILMLVVCYFSWNGDVIIINIHWKCGGNEVFKCNTTLHCNGYNNYYNYAFILPVENCL